MSSPLISIAMPYYNDAQSLPMALASLIAQRYEEWECLLIDDGSVESPAPIVDAFGDPRIQLLHLGHNLGTAIARQVALDHAQGEYLCMLDADDWYYPEKLMEQLAVMVAEPRLTLVSAGMAIVDERATLLGVRRRGVAGKTPTMMGPWRRLSVLPVAHAPSMVRMDRARRVHYNPALRRSQDTDFLLNVLWDGYFTVLPSILYTYAEYRSATPEKLLASYRYRMAMFWGQRHRNYGVACSNILMTFGKLILYRLAVQMGMEPHLIAQRSQKPGAADVAHFESAKAVVSATVQKYIGQ